MLIIVEGPDGAGKSSFVEQLNRELDSRNETRRRFQFHARPPKSHPLDEYVKPLLHIHPMRQIAICDRWHWGEVVYPSVLRRKTQMDAGVLRYIEMFLRTRGAIIVHLNTSLEMLTDRIMTRGDDFVHVRQLPQLRTEYQLVHERSLVPVLGKNPTPSLTIAAAAQAAHVMMDLTPFTTYVGPRFPRVLLVGDKRSTTEVTFAPAFMPYPATSGHFLMTALMNANIGRDAWMNIGLANANDVDDITKLYDILGRPRVIALGRNAAHTLHRNTIPHSLVPHPQFVRRFYHREAAAYGRMVRAATLDPGDYGSWRP
jgi:thymidylate kinase